LRIVKESRRPRTLTRAAATAILARFAAAHFHRFLQREEKGDPSMTFMRAQMAALAMSALVTGLVAALTGTGHAAEAFKMGVVDPQAVLEKSKAGRRALDGLKEHAASRQKLLAKDEEDLKGLEGQLKAQESSITEGQKREKQAQFRTKIQDYQKRVQDFNQELAVKQKELVDEYMKKIQVATKAVADKNGFSLVVDKGSDQTIKIVIYNKEAIDLTEQVIKEFDKQNK
jgi:outer membrane protein